MSNSSCRNMYRWSKPVLIGLVTAGAMLCIYGRVTVLDVSNACAIAGILLLCIGGFQLVCRSGFFELPAFGIKKFWEVITHRDYGEEQSRIGDFQEYLLKEKKKTSVVEYLLAGFIFLIISAILLMV